MDSKKTGLKNLKLKCTLRAPITVYWVSCIRDEIYIWSQIGDQTKMGKLGKLGTLTSQSPPTLCSSRPSAWSSTWSSHWNRQSNQKKVRLPRNGLNQVYVPRSTWCSLTFRTKSTSFIPIVGFPIREASDTGEIRIYRKPYQLKSWVFEKKFNTA